jgi:hypothetical protein
MISGHSDLVMDRGGSFRIRVSQNRLRSPQTPLNPLCWQDAEASCLQDAALPEA